VKIVTTLINKHLALILPVLLWSGVFDYCQAQISPGKLSRFHETLEGVKNCTSCHEIGEEPTPDKCLKCHKLLSGRIQANKGYHSAPAVRSQKCLDCHSEHHGRDFDLIFWKEGTEKFDHRQTGWLLEGKHAKARCRDCHQEKFLSPELKTAQNTSKIRTFLGLRTECTACHIDEHRGTLSANCVKCHDHSQWAPAPGFEHNQSKYKLTGKHAGLPCQKCHPSIAETEAAPQDKIDGGRTPSVFTTYTGLQYQNCVPCHQDAHWGKLGLDCKQCHNATGFKTTQEKFDHSRTDYILQGKHQTVECRKCHKSGKMTEPLKFANCSDCHTDTHRGQFAARADKGDCAACHTVDGFIPAKYTLEEHQKSVYPLTGAHLAIPCDLCHKKTVSASGEKSQVFAFSDKSCSGCHKDVHNKQADKWMTQAGCQDCHSVDTWHKVTFEHNLSRFKLQGKHRQVTCRKCHYPDNKVTLTGLTAECSGCHSDFHRGQFDDMVFGAKITKCGKCHSEESWKILIFDHNRDAKFLLTGAHAKLDCWKCHITVQDSEGKTYVKYKPLGKSCPDCHDKY